jgi:hypothetical protein
VASYNKHNKENRSQEKFNQIKNYGDHWQWWNNAVMSLGGHWDEVYSGSRCSFWRCCPSGWGEEATVRSICKGLK